MNITTVAISTTTVIIIFQTVFEGETYAISCKDTIIMMIMQILAAITPHCLQTTCSLNIPYMSSDYVGRLANLRGIVLRFHNSLILQANKNIFNLFAIFFRFFFAICNYHVIFAALLSIKITKTVT